MKKTAFIASTALLAALPFAFSAFSPAHAKAKTSQACVAAYRDAADSYWQIATDMAQFKAMFDNYNQLCRKYYPEEIAALEPEAKLLQRQTTRDMDDMPKVMVHVFNESLPGMVPGECRNDTKARNKARTQFLVSLKSRTSAMETRLRKSAALVRDPQSELKLCRDLPGLAPKIRTALGPDLANPLLTMTEINSAYVTGETGSLKASFATYREILQKLDSKKK